jgi:hypothetical protein
MRAARFSFLLAALLVASPALAQSGHDEHNEAEADAFEGAAPEVGLVGRLVMMKGHLRVGRELWSQGDRDTAAGHFLHPLVELDGDVEPELQRRQLKPIKPELEALGAAPEKGEPAVFREYDRARTAIDRALAAAAKPVRRSPGASYDVLLRLARQAAYEYGNGLEGDKVIAPVEYQDGRGFLLAGRDFLKSVDGLLAGKSAEGARALDAEWGRMLKAFPTVKPPERIVISHDELVQSVTRIEALRPRFQ